MLMTLGFYYDITLDAPGDAYTLTLILQQPVESVLSSLNSARSHLDKKQLYLYFYKKKKRLTNLHIENEVQLVTKEDEKHT